MAGHSRCAHSTDLWIPDCGNHPGGLTDTEKPQAETGDVEWGQQDGVTAIALSPFSSRSSLSTNAETKSERTPSNVNASQTLEFAHTCTSRDMSVTTTDNMYTSRVTILIIQFVLKKFFIISHFTWLSCCSLQLLVTWPACDVMWCDTTVVVVSPHGAHGVSSFRPHECTTNFRWGTR